ATIPDRRRSLTRPHSLESIHDIAPMDQGLAFGSCSLLCMFVFGKHQSVLQPLADMKRAVRAVCGYELKLFSTNTQKPESAHGNHPKQPSDKGRSATSFASNRSYW